MDRFFRVFRAGACHELCLRNIHYTASLVGGR